MKHVETNTYNVQRLLHVKGKKNVVAGEVGDGGGGWLAQAPEPPVQARPQIGSGLKPSSSGPLPKASQGSVHTRFSFTSCPKHLH